MGSPPKPWERAGSMAAVVDPTPSIPATSAPSTADSSSAPLVPSRPESIGSTQPGLVTSLSPFSSSTSYGSSYSPYNRFGSYGSSYGGYGGYGGSMYGGYGGSYGGMGGMYGQPQFGMGAPGMDPSLTQSVAASTQQAFGLLGNVVGTFTSFAQMLDSSFMATQSSIFAILGVADQLSQLRALVGQVAGVFGLVGWLRGWFRRDKRGAMTADFKKFLRGEGDGTPRPSKKPFIMILLAIFGLPYLMHKLVRALSARLPPPPGSVEQFDMSKVQFATALFDFAASDPVELGLKRGDLVAIVGRTEGGDWFRGRTREGKQGWFPANHVQILKKDEKMLASKAVEEQKEVKSVV